MIFFHKTQYEKSWGWTHTLVTLNAQGVICARRRSAHKKKLTKFPELSWILFNGCNVICILVVNGVVYIRLLCARAFLHDDVIKWKHFPRSWPFVGGIRRSAVDTHHKARDLELWCFLWCAPEQTTEQTVEIPVFWDVGALIVTSL